MRTPALDQVPAIAALLSESGLPTDDLSEQDIALFRIEGTNDRLVAVGGLQPFDDVALIRSVATAASMRGRGLAGTIVDELEGLAQERSFCSLYLLTESAARFFGSRGYLPVDRSNVPSAIQKSRQFASLCPDSAIVMWKQLDV